MSDYRRYYVPGGTFFLTFVTYQRIPLFRRSEAVDCLRASLRQVQAEMPFDFPAGVVLPDHAHFVWSLPRGDVGYSRRIGRMKILFTRTIREQLVILQERTASRQKHREANVWQRRFWEHTIVDEGDYERHLDYIHYNPVKHGLVTCPHLWPHSSFSHHVRGGLYTDKWGCCCGGRTPVVPRLEDIARNSGE
jgi:putative transposase